MKGTLEDVALSVQHNARFVGGRLVIFALAGLLGWTLAYLIHHGVIWMRTPPNGEMVSIGASFQQVADAIRQALYR